MDKNKKSKFNEIGGGIFFFAGVFSLLGCVFKADGASPGTAFLGIAIGLPLFWPRLKIWLNKINFDSK
jgi:hypothetical protein